MTKSRNTFIWVSLILAFLPGILFLIYVSLSNIRGDFCGMNGVPIFLYFLIFGLPIMGLGLVTYIFADKKLKRKFIVLSSIIIFSCSILPINWLINDLKTQSFVSKHKFELEELANNLLTKKLTFEEGEKILSEKNLPLSLFEKNEKETTVLLLISGILDNCNGIAFSKNGKKPRRNNCGKLVTWEKIEMNWYKWGTV